MSTTGTGKIFLHVDFNAYFASLEQQANPFLRNKAIAVGGKPGTRSVVTTASYTAKRLGVKTAMSSHEAQRVCPELEMVHGDPRKYSYITDHFHVILARYASEMSSTSIDEVYMDVTEAAVDWMGALSIALCIRQDIANELGAHVTVSIGIADNMLLAKIASNAEKPHGITCVTPDNVDHFLWTRELQDVPGIGPRLEARLHALGISSLKSLRLATKPWLIKHFKQYGHFLYEAARGRGATVFDEKEPPKSIGHCYTLPYNTQHHRHIIGTLSRLADKAAWRLRNHGLAARKYAAIMRFENKRFASEQGVFDAPTQDGHELFKAAWSHMEPIAEREPLRLVGVVARDLVPAHSQNTMDAKKQKSMQLLQSLDRIQHRYGKNSWFRPVQMGAPLKERSSGFHFDHKI